MKVVKVKPQSQTQHNRPHSVCQLARVSRFIFGMCVTFACKRGDWMFKHKSSKTQQKEWMQEQIQAGTWHWEKQHPTVQDLGLPKLYGCIFLFMAGQLLLLCVPSHTFIWATASKHSLITYSNLFWFAEACWYDHRCHSGARVFAKINTMC